MIVRYVTAVAAIVLPLAVFRIIPAVNALESEAKRAVATLLVWPCVREIALIMIRHASFEVTHHDTRADQAYVISIYSFGTIVTRFLMNNMDTTEARLSKVA